MSGLKHDAHQCRQTAKSEVIRHSLGLLTQSEIDAIRDAMERKQEAQAREAAKGSPLFGGEE